MVLALEAACQQPPVDSGSSGEAGGSAAPACADRVAQLLREQRSTQRLAMEAQRADWGMLCRASARGALAGALPSCCNPKCTSAAADPYEAAGGASLPCRNRCGAVSYCSQVCQAEGWAAGHQLVCGGRGGSRAARE